MWLLSSRLFIATLYTTTCAYQSFHYSVATTHNQWHTVAAAYDHDSNVVSLWMDGQLEQVQWAACSEDMLNSDAISMGKR